MVNDNAGLCGDLVSVGSVGTNYNGGIVGTNLGNPCLTYPCCAAGSSSQAWRDTHAAHIARMRRFWAEL
jgi:hypothetical protein